MLEQDFAVVQAAFMERPRAPDFICIGAAKAGTTWLYRALRNTPGYRLPPVKELRYFGQKDIGDRDKGRLGSAEAADMAPEILEWMRNYVSGSPKDDAWYLSLFAFAADDITGDISPAYAPLAPAFIQQAKRVSPNASILMFVRNPYERNVSHLANLAARTLLGPKRQRDMYHKTGATLTADMLCAEQTAPIFLRQSQQAVAVRQWREVFGDRVNVFFYDDLVANPAAFLDKVTRAIGRQSRPNDEATLLERANPMVPLSQEDVATVRDAIRPMCEKEIADLNSEIGPIPYVWN